MPRSVFKHSTKRLHTKKTKTKEPTKRPTAGNLRSLRTMKATNSSYKLKKFKEVQVLQANIIADLLINAALVAGLAGLGVGTADGLNAEVDLNQAEELMHQVADHAAEPALIHEQINAQVALARIRQNACGNLRISLRSLVFILVHAAVCYSGLRFPFFTSPNESSFFNEAAGYYAMPVSTPVISSVVTSFLTVEEIATYTACSIGLKALGAATRMGAALTGRHPMTTFQAKSEIFKILEDKPEQSAEFLKYKTIVGKGKLLYHSYASGVDIHKLGKIMLMSPVEVAIELGKLKGMSKEASLKELSAETIASVALMYDP